MSFTYSDVDAGLEALSDIEGYEFLSDLDAGFEEELRTLVSILHLRRPQSPGQKRSHDVGSSVCCRTSPVARRRLLRPWSRKRRKPDRR